MLSICCAGSFDLYRHVGVNGGMHYTMGYCLAGLPMGTYLGRKMATCIPGEPVDDTLFSERPFPAKW